MTFACLESRENNNSSFEQIILTHTQRERENERDRQTERERETERERQRERDSERENQEKLGCYFVCAEVYPYFQGFYVHGKAHTCMITTHL